MNKQEQKKMKELLEYLKREDSLTNDISISNIKIIAKSIMDLNFNDFYTRFNFILPEIANIKYKNLLNIIKELSVLDENNTIDSNLQYLYVIALENDNLKLFNNLFNTNPLMLFPSSHLIKENTSIYKYLINSEIDWKGIDAKNKLKDDYVTYNELIYNIIKDKDCPYTKYKMLASAILYLNVKGTKNLLENGASIRFEVNGIINDLILSHRINPNNTKSNKIAHTNEVRGLLVKNYPDEFKVKENLNWAEFINRMNISKDSFIIYEFKNYILNGYIDINFLNEKMKAKIFCNSSIDEARNLLNLIKNEDVSEKLSYSLYKETINTGKIELLKLLFNNEIDPSLYIKSKSFKNIILQKNKVKKDIIHINYVANALNSFYLKKKLNLELNVNHVVIKKNKI